MKLLLIDASKARAADGTLLDPERPSRANGSVLNELGDGTTLAVHGAGDALPPFDVQFEPGCLRGVRAVAFTLTRDDGSTLVVVDNAPPFAVSRVPDGVFEAVPFLTQDGVYTVEAQPYSRDLRFAPGQPDTPSDLEPFDAFKKGPPLVVSNVEVSTAATAQTEFDGAPAASEAEAESEVEVATADGAAKEIGRAHV